MKNVKNILSALAFIFAIGAVFAFTPSKSTSALQIDVQGAHALCPDGKVDATCSTENTGDICTFFAPAPIGQTVEAIPDGTSSGCVNAERLQLPPSQ